MRRLILLFAVALVPPAAVGQKMDSYIETMGKALEPYGTITAPNCHRVEIDLNGPWGDYGIISGVDKEHPGQPTWAIVHVDTFRLFMDLADLNEDKVRSDMIFSLDYVTHHQRGTKYVEDTPTVLIAASDLSKVTVHQVDLNKLKALEGKTHIPESEFPFILDTVSGVMIVFEDKQHADYFQKALQKAIVLCKADD